CEVTLARPGVYVLDEVPSPVHGAFWTDSPASVELVMKLRDVEVPAAEAAPGNLQEDLAGKKVTLYFKGSNRPPVVGTMMKLKPKADETGPARPYGAEPAPGRFLVLQSAKGRVYVEASEVAS